MATQFTHLTNLPAIDIPYRVASERYGVQVAALMDRLAESRAEASTKSMSPSSMKWSLVCERSPDPANCDDQKAFLDYLASNSSYYLKVVAVKWISYEPILQAPPQFVAQFDQRARHIINGRMSQKTPKHSECDTDKDGNPLMAFLDVWCLEHRHHPQLAKIARFALEQLIESASEPD